VVVQRHLTRDWIAKDDNELDLGECFGTSYSVVGIVNSLRIKQGVWRGIHDQVATSLRLTVCKLARVKCGALLVPRVLIKEVYFLTEVFLFSG